MDLLKLAQLGAGGDAVDENLDENLDASGASPDELLLELMDLVALAFPQALRSMTISFVPNEDGQRPALSDLDGKAAADAPRRPDFGHGESEILDFINHLLGELAEATWVQGGIRVLRGRLEIKENDDGGRDVALVDDAVTGDEGQPPVVVMTRTFDKSELRWLFFSPELYQLLNETESAETESQGAMTTLLSGMSRFAIDMARARITFSSTPSSTPSGDVSTSSTTYRFELMGSWMEETHRFMWGWANSQVDERVYKALTALRAKSTGQGLRAFTDASFGGPEAMFFRIASHTAVRLGAQGIYRAPFAGRQGKGVMFLALFEEVAA